MPDLDSWGAGWIQTPFSDGEKGWNYATMICAEQSKLACFAEMEQSLRKKFFLVVSIFIRNFAVWNQNNNLWYKNKRIE